MTSTQADKKENTTKDSGVSGGRRVTTPVATLADLVGAHPDAIRSIYETGRPADPAELGDAPRGRLLSLQKGSDLFLLTRPILRALSAEWNPWKGKIFDHGGQEGQNVVFGKNVGRFRVQTAPSRLDGKPSLVLTYDDEAHKNPWPVRDMVDELRLIGSGIAIRPAFLQSKGDATPLFWFGLELR